jgi:hypothetical protein
MKRILVLAIISILGISGYSQIGGKHTYGFLNLTSSPTVAALGGKLISYGENDLSLTYYNPALLNSAMNYNLNLDYVNYFAGINYGYLSYSHPISNYNFAVGMQYYNYGKFIGAETNGDITGSFSAAEYALNIAASYALDSFFTIGADIRPILSTLEQYNSFGISTDFGIVYKNSNKLYNLALVVRNLGTQIKTYSGTYETLPFEIQLGYTQKLRYAPFIISVTAHHLETFDMSVENDDDSETITIGGEKEEKRKIEKIGDQMMRHLIVGVDFTPFKNFYFRLGYNYQRRQEMKVDTRLSTVGISWGFGLAISKFKINFGRATYHLAGASNHFSLVTDLSSLYKKR